MIARLAKFATNMYVPWSIENLMQFFRSEIPFAMSWGNKSNTYLNFVENGLLVKVSILTL